MIEMQNIDLLLTNKTSDKQDMTVVLLYNNMSM